MKKKGGAGNSVFQPAVDRHHLLGARQGRRRTRSRCHLGYGRTDAPTAASSRGSSRCSPTTGPGTAIVKFIGSKEGGMDKLKGKKIVPALPRLGLRQGTHPVLRRWQAKKYGFDVIKIAVAHPGNEQQSQWLQIRQAKPDWVILWGWGVMNPTALKAAAKIGFPRDKMSASGGPAPRKTPSRPATPPRASSPPASTWPGQLPGRQGHPEARLRQEQGQHGRQDAHRLDLLQPRRGARHHHRGGDPQGPGKYGKGKVDDRRADALGLREPEHRRPPEGTGCRPASCRPEDDLSDHEGSGKVKFQQWDGKQWKVITDWIDSDKELVRGMIEESAAKYAKEKGIKPARLLQGKLIRGG
jgi:branched-chain amino acid transport system substrate-binding protein